MPFRKACKPASLNVVERDPITKNVRPDGFAAVIPQLKISLRRALRSQRTRTGVEAVARGIERHAFVSEGQVAANRGIHDLVLEFQIGEAYGVGEGTTIKIQADNVRARNILVVVNRVA